MSSDFGNVLQNELGGVLSRFLAQHGESAENSTHATKIVLPTVVAGLVKHISNDPSHLKNLHDTLTGTASTSLNRAVIQVEEGGSGLDSIMQWGREKLPVWFSGNAADVSDQIAHESGIAKATAGSLLALSLPLVLSVLSKKVKAENLNQRQLAGVLSNQHGWLSSTLSSGILSALGIGSLSGIFGGLSSWATGTAANAAGAAAAKSSGLGKWIALVIAALVALFAYKSCSTQKQPVPPADVTVSAPEETNALAASDLDTETIASSVMPSEPSNIIEPVASAPEQDIIGTASAPMDNTAASVPAIAPDQAGVVYQNGMAVFYFATSQNNIAEGAEQIVGEVIKAGKAGKKLVISGFADSTGNAAANAELSKQRANAVKAFFEAQGVDTANIELRKPENTTGAIGNDVEGRRVEVTVEG